VNGPNRTDRWRRLPATPRANWLGGSALACTGIAYTMVLAYWNEPLPRWSVVVPLALAVVLAGGWLLVSRATGALPDPAGPLPAPYSPDRSGAEPPPIPAKLPPLRRHASIIVSGFLSVWAPFFAVLGAMSAAFETMDDNPNAPELVFILLLALAMIIGLVGSFAGLGLLTRTIGPPSTVLRDDAGDGRVRAIRVRIGTAVLDHRPHGDRVPHQDVHDVYLALAPHGDGETSPAELRFGPMKGDSFTPHLAERHFWNSVHRITGEDAWLCWPRNWEHVHLSQRLRSRVMPAVLVTDSGDLVWGRTGEREWIPHLRDKQAPLRDTDPGRAVAPPPHLSRYDPRSTPKRLLVGVAAVLLAGLCAAGIITGWAAVAALVAVIPLTLWAPHRFPLYEGVGRAWSVTRVEED
jgi:hypothetical protein